MKKFLIAAAALSVLVTAGAAGAQSYQGRPGGSQGGYLNAPAGGDPGENTASIICIPGTFATSGIGAFSPPESGSAYGTESR